MTLHPNMEATPVWERGRDNCTALLKRHVEVCPGLLLYVVCHYSSRKTWIAMGISCRDPMDLIVFRATNLK